MSTKTWEDVRESIRNCNLGRDTTEFNLISTEIIQAALSLTFHLENREENPPTDVYPMPDDAITLEWKFNGFCKVYMEVEGPGRAEVMITSEGEPTKFEEFCW